MGNLPHFFNDVHNDQVTTYLPTDSKRSSSDTSRLQDILKNVTIEIISDSRMLPENVKEQIVSAVVLNSAHLNAMTAEAEESLKKESKKTKTCGIILKIGVFLGMFGVLITFFTLLLRNAYESRSYSFHV